MSIAFICKAGANKSISVLVGLKQKGHGSTLAYGEGRLFYWDECST